MPRLLSVASLDLNPDPFLRYVLVSQQHLVRVGDIGHAELGTEHYDVAADHNGIPSAAMAIR
jgi:HAE1 family hydrophobic/amphiphilic exporter-1